ncbi:MAG: DUF2892 domain-containing protein [Nannocystaceae bacterium]|nr:DUF2892 domain-containing protein [Nannocystaceae bacterium]
MKRNLANWERMLRVFGGLSVLAAGAFLVEPQWVALAVAASGVGLAVTGAVARCPACMIAGIGSYRTGT